MTKFNAVPKARMAICKDIRDNKKLPDICKNLMIEVVLGHFDALSLSLGNIELSARRAAEHGLEKS